MKPFKWEYCKGKFLHKTSLKCQNLQGTEKRLYQGISFDSLIEPSENVDQDQLIHSNT